MDPEEIRELQELVDPPYTAVTGNGVTDASGRHIPAHNRNRQWRAYQWWLAQDEANQPETDPEETRPNRRRRVVDRINEIRNHHLLLGVMYRGFRFQTDPISTLNVTTTLTGLQAGLTLPPGFTWRSADNEDVPFVPVDLRNLVAAGFARQNAIYQYSWSLKAQVQAADDPFTIDIQSGWPT